MTRIEWDGTMQRRMVDTAQRGDGPGWEDLTGRALAILPLYRPVPRAPVYHIRVDDTVVQAAEQDLTGPLLDLITAVLALGEQLLPTYRAKPVGHGQTIIAARRQRHPYSGAAPAASAPASRGSTAGSITVLAVWHANGGQPRPAARRALRSDRGATFQLGPFAPAHE